MVIDSQISGKSSCFRFGVNKKYVVLTGHCLICSKRCTGISLIVCAIRYINNAKTHMSQIGCYHIGIMRGAVFPLFKEFAGSSTWSIAPSEVFSRYMITDANVGKHSVEGSAIRSGMGEDVSQGHFSRPDTRGDLKIIIIGKKRET